MERGDHDPDVLAATFLWKSSSALPRVGLFLSLPGRGLGGGGLGAEIVTTDIRKT